MPESERAALIALFDATGGPQWAHKVGWLGPPGTECNWHGVDGAAKYSEPTTNVTGLDLHDNNLRGDVPEAFGELPHLKTLHVGDDDALTGKLPPPLLRRWLSGDLEVLTSPGSLCTDVTAIEIDSSEFSWCGGRTRRCSRRVGRTRNSWAHDTTSRAVRAGDARPCSPCRGSGLAWTFYTLIV